MLQVAHRKWWKQALHLHATPSNLYDSHRATDWKCLKLFFSFIFHWVFICNFIFFILFLNHFFVFIYFSFFWFFFRFLFLQASFFSFQTSFFSFRTSFFFIFLARGTWNPGKPWKSTQKNGRPSKTKENEKKWSCKWKKMKIWTQSCRFSLRTRKFSKTRKFSFFYDVFFSFSLPVAPEIQQNHENQWKTMENHQKQRKMKKKWSCKWKKWKFGLKVADSHSEPGNLQKRGNFHFFYHFFSFSLPVAPEIQEIHEN